MEANAQKVFEEYLLNRLEGKKDKLDDKFQKLSYEERIALNQKFSALKNLEKVFGSFSKIGKTPRANLIKETASLENKTLAGCKIIRRLGQGGVGVVYLARQEKLNRDVAIKVLRRFAADNESLLKRFRRESRIIAQLDHKNIVPVYDIGEEEGSIYIIMKYIEGVSLETVLDDLKNRDRSLLQLVDLEEAFNKNIHANHKVRAKFQGKNPTDFFCHLIIKVAKALEYAHEKGIVHRDIKPGNIMLRSDGEPVLFDFGMGRDEAEQARTLTGEFLGTPIYSAPESFQKKDPGKLRLLDVYSLGATLYELLTGGLPYEGNSVYEVFSNLKNKEPLDPKSFWKDLPKDLGIVLLKAIYRDPDYRYSSVQEFRGDLERFIEYKPILATPPSWMQRISYYAKRNRAAVFIGLLLPVLLLAVVSVVVLFWDLQKSREEQTHLLALADLNELHRINAESIFDQVNEINLEKTQALTDLKLFNQGENKDLGPLIQTVEKKLMAKPNDLPLLELLAEAYLEQKDFPKAENIARRMLVLDPKNIPAFLVLAEIQILNNQDLNASKELVRKFNHEFPDRSGGNGLLGTQCLIRQNYPCAIEFLSKAAKQNPLKYSKVLAGAYLDSGDFPQAEEAYHRALNYYPNDPEIFDALALALAKMNRMEEAEVYAQRALQVTPDNEKRLRLLNSLQAHQKPAAPGTPK